MRLFIAIDIPEEIKGYLISLQEKLNTDSAKLKPVDRSKMHLTLKFLGEVREEEIDEIKENLSIIKIKPFNAKLDRIGVFPNMSYIKVIWVGIIPPERIIEIQKQIDNSLIKLFNKEKNFAPHITIARVKFVKERESFAKTIEAIKIESKEFEIKEFKLIKSILTQDGAVYNEL